MIFFEYFKHQIGQKIIVLLKNGIEIDGLLENIDTFLNIKINRAHATVISGIQKATEESNLTEINMENGMGNLKTCSIRGSAIKLIKLGCIGIESKVTEATRLKFSIDH